MGRISGNTFVCKCFTYHIVFIEDYSEFLTGPRVFLRALVRDFDVRRFSFEALLGFVFTRYLGDFEADVNKATSLLIASSLFACWLLCASVRIRIVPSFAMRLPASVRKRFNTAGLMLVLKVALNLS